MHTKTMQYKKCAITFTLKIREGVSDIILATSNISRWREERSLSRELLPVNQTIPHQLHTGLRGGRRRQKREGKFTRRRGELRKQHRKWLLLLILITSLPSFINSLSMASVLDSSSRLRGTDDVILMVSAMLFATASFPVITICFSWRPPIMYTRPSDCQLRPITKYSRFE